MNEKSVLQEQWPAETDDEAPRPPEMDNHLLTLWRYKQVQDFWVAARQ